MPQALIATPGPVHTWIRFRSNPVAPYFGTCVENPEPEHDRAYLPIFNDLGGVSKAFQLVQDGEDAIVSMVLNRFDMNVYRGIRALIGAAGGGTISTLGNETAFARGTLVLGSSDFELVTVNKYAGTPAAGNSDLNIGRRYYSCVLEKYAESKKGNRVLAISLLIKCENGFNVSGPYAQGFSLYSETDMGSLAPII